MAAGVWQGCCLPSAGVCSSGALLALLVWMGLWLEGRGWPLPSHTLLQEVAVETLLQATGLPAALVHHALTPLTHGDRVLVGSCMPGGECGLGHPWGGVGLSFKWMLGQGCVSL